MPTDTIDLRSADTSDALDRTTDGSREVFPRPPLAFVDEAGRRIEIRVGDAVVDSLVEMYVDYDDADRAQGLPPRGEERIRDWLEDIFDAGCHLLAWHDDRVVGHATLISMDDSGAELAIFVDGDYQNAGIGSCLLRTLLGHGRANGVERVWLTVSRDNYPAISLYRSAGFETTAQGLEVEMERSLEDAP